MDGGMGLNEKIHQRCIEMMDRQAHQRKRNEWTSKLDSALLRVQNDRTKLNRLGQANLNGPKIEKAYNIREAKYYSNLQHLQFILKETMPYEERVQNIKD